MVWIVSDVPAGNTASCSVRVSARLTMRRYLASRTLCASVSSFSFMPHFSGSAQFAPSLSLRFVRKAKDTLVSTDVFSSSFLIHAFSYEVISSEKSLRVAGAPTAFLAAAALAAWKMAQRPCPPSSM